MHRASSLIHSQNPNSLQDLLLTKPYLFEFSQAIRLLHDMHTDAHPLGRNTNPMKEAVYLKARIFLSAPPSDLYKIKRPATHRTVTELRDLWKAHKKHTLSLERFVWHTPPQLLLLTYEAKNQGLPENITQTLFEHGPLEVHVNFLGIAGIQGPLPTPYTELLLSRLRRKDTVMKDFLNLFNHRFLSIHYRITQKLNPALYGGEPQHNPVGKALVRLMGVGTDTHSAFPTRDLLCYTRFFWKKPHTPVMLTSILKDYFGVQTQLLSFQGKWFPLEHYKKTALGDHKGQNNCLGQTAVVGRRVWCQDQGLTVCLTLNSPEQFLSFLPSGDAYPFLKQLTRTYIGPRFSINFGLKLTRKPPSQLTPATDKQSFPFILGWSSWLLKDTSYGDSPWVTIS